MRFQLEPRSMTLHWKTAYFPVLGVNISQTVRTSVARLPLRQLGFLVSLDIMLLLLTCTGCG